MKKTIKINEHEARIIMDALLLFADKESKLVKEYDEFIRYYESCNGRTDDIKEARAKVEQRIKNIDNIYDRVKSL